MRKKELLEKIPKKLPDHNTARIIRAGGEQVLMVILPEWQKRDPKANGWVDRTGLVHFCWKWGYLTYYITSGTWSQEGFGWIENTSSLQANNFDKKSCDAIGHFTGRLPTPSSIEYYEQDVKWRLKRKYENNKQSRINKIMKETTPPLPANFKSWCGRRCFKPGIKLYVKLFQRSGEEYMERIFELVNSTGWKLGGYCEEDKGKLRITEICRAISKQCGGVWKVWYYGEQYGAYGRSQRFWDKKGNSVVNVLPKKHILYDNLDELELTQAERSCARIMDGLADPAEIIYAVRHHEGLERLIKAGLKRLAREIMNLNTESWIKRVECLRKDQLKRLAQYDGGVNAWELLKLFPNITDRNLKEFCRIRSEFKESDILRFKEDYNLNLNHLFTLWRNTGGIRQNVITEYRDYLEMARQRGSNIHDEIIYRNKRWKEFHDRYVEERNAELARQKAEREKAKADRWKGINRDYKRNTKIFGWKKDGYCIIVPKSADEINEEGRKQHHCVGAQEQYKNRMAARQSYIVFLRKVENPKKPYYTIEVDENGVKQFYAAYDRQPDKKEVQSILTEWMKQVRKNFRAEKKSNKKAKPVATAQKAV
ncbi:MAG: PcfJ domain-containing protein [Lachnospiraceae bacterium]|nr:PcfJ domain-containing protein [Lachnospiraceae bacterium]MBR3374219.1 PcfJ domain-containing protein [Bacillota bacterium]